MPEQIVSNWRGILDNVQPTTWVTIQEAIKKVNEQRPEAPLTPDKKLTMADLQAVLAVTDDSNASAVINFFIDLGWY